jgi:K+-transporting ATPase ATPase B chain
MSHTELVKQPRRSLPISQVVTGAVKGLAPHLLARNPVMAVVAIGTVVCFGLTPIAFVQGENGGFALTSLLLLATVLFATGAESLAESRGKAHAGALRKTKGELQAAKLNADGTTSDVTADSLRKGDRVKVVAGELIPADGDIVEGAASINESAVTGESAPVLREAGTDNSGVSAGTKVLSDQLIIEVSANPGESLLDRMIALVEGASRQKTPSELALSVLLAMLTLVFLIVVVTLVPMARSLG